MTIDRDPPDDLDADDDEPRRRSRLEALIPDLLRKALRDGAGALTDEKMRETLVADVVRKAISVGNDVVEGTEGQVRKILSDVPIPKEVGDRVTGKLDEFKGEMFRIVKQEVHEFLEKVDVGAELQRVLTSLSFEIVTEIRFIPNEKGGPPGVRPDVKSGVRVKKADGPRAPRRSRRQPPPADQT
jgi:hypothetical protein